MITEPKTMCAVLVGTRKWIDPWVFVRFPSEERGDECWFDVTDEMWWTWDELMWMKSMHWTVVYEGVAA